MIYVNGGGKTPVSHPLIWTRSSSHMTAVNRRSRGIQPIQEASHSMQILSHAVCVCVCVCVYTHTHTHTLVVIAITSTDNCSKD
jgi:hypothetical protein